MMWKCDKLHHWLSSSTTESSDKRYRHRLLKENLIYRPEILEDIKLLIQQAHNDFRRYFRGFTANTLDLWGGRVPDLAKGYPECFDLTDLKGYFGEIFAGLIAENFSPFGINDWKVPAFLFRFHNVAFDQLERMRDSGEAPKKMVGRTGNDCLAFQLDGTGRVKRTLICEAKCTDTHNSNMIVEAHEQISDPGSIPVSVWQLIEILEDRPHDNNVLTWVAALVGLRLGDVNKNYERYDLISYVHGQLPVKKPTWIPQDTPHPKYTGKRQLEAVEIHLHNVDELIQEVYRKVDTKPEPRKLPTEITHSRKRIVELARALLENRAEKFPRTTARLYSQHTKLRANQPGLPSWRSEEFWTQLDDAIRLVEAAFIERNVLQGNAWRSGVRRAGELLEWLTHAEMNTERLPLCMLSAAAYQLAGYPARATGILSEHLREDTESKILYAFLKTDFPDLLRTLTTYWGTPIDQNVAGFDFSDTLVSFPDFQYLVVKETASALGILCSAIRWGDEERLDKALEKLSTVSKMLLHGDDFYSWLLAKLCSEVIATYAKSSLRFHLAEFSLELNEVGQQALESYLRLGYQHRQTLAWPSQICGIERLKLQQSFSLCTPTGSGKTTVAELAILQSLFSETARDVPEFDNEDSALQDPFSDIFLDEQSMATDNCTQLAIYLVPSRALAAEVENKLSRALVNTNIIVTGLYGGTDWGPTDVWLTEEKPIVLICTYEKAEALMRFLGPFFRDRISLVVIDEAHSVDFGYRQDDSQERINLQKAESRALRLESLGTRLLAHLQEHHSRVIALSAVASGIEHALAGWVSGQADALPAKTSYRSTRQLIGRLECSRDKRFSIRYDLLGRENLQFEKDSEDTPYIPNPFPPHPSAPDFENKGPEKRLRPSLLWAAMHLAKPDEQGQQHAVLISITQRIDGYVEDFLTLLEQTWDKVDKPDFFHPPTEPCKIRIWKSCLKSCEDYFTSQSYEYRLLERGIIVHHGNMPGLMARLLVEAIQEQIVHIVVATSTLSEGVNLPFETVLIPSLRRSGKPLNIREFGNLVGRAGRPGFGTEGRSLVLVAPGSNQEKAYIKLVKQLQVQNIATDNAQSPLAQLLISLYEQWRHISKSPRIDEFLTWLEQTAPLASPGNSDNEPQADVIETLDTLDSVLLAAIVEVEQIAGQEELSLDELEEQLRRIWQHSYARYATMKEQDQAHLESFFIQRGRALKARIYPDPVKRKKLYRTSLPPRSGEELSNLYPTIKQHLETGKEYAYWKNPEQRFDYIQTVVEQLTSLPKFPLDPSPSKKGWQNVLRWWVKMEWGTYFPLPKENSEWYKYVNRNFIYKFNWGLGSIIALAMEGTNQDLLPTIENWPETGLPWIVFWLKELIIWGTLEPVAAYLLARRIEITRAEAEVTARKYYEEQSDIQNPDEFLNAVAIRKWAQELSGGVETQEDVASEPELPSLIPVTLLKDFTQAPKQTWRVLPVETETKLFWYDPAGVPLASCEKFEGWQPQYLHTHDFMLNSSEKVVSSKPYI